MRLYWEEFKKIWRLPVLCVIILLNVAYFYLFPLEYLNYAYQSLNGYAEMDILTEMRREYGPTLEPEERLDADKYIQRCYALLDPLIQNDPIYAQAGIYSGADLWALDRDNESSEDRDDAMAHAEFVASLTGPFYFGEYMEASGSAMWKLQALDVLYFPSYDRFEAESEDLLFGYDLGNDRMNERLFQYAKDKAHRNLFSDKIYVGATYYFAAVVIIQILSVGILLMPFLTRDRQSGMTQMQFTSPKGRGILRTQFGAAMTSVFILITVQLVFFMMLFFKSNDYSLFYHQPVFTVMWHEYVPVLNLTFLQFVVVSAGLCYVLSFGSSALFFFLSHYSGDYVSMLFKALPLAAALSLTGVGVLLRPLTFNNILYRYISVTGAEVIVCIIILILGLGLCTVSLRRAQTVDLG